MPGTHMEVHVGAKSFGHLLGFLSGKGLAVNFDARSITIVGPESTPPTFTENNKPELLLFQPLPHRLPCMSCGQTVKTPWYAIIRGLEVGVRHTWGNVRDAVCDANGKVLPNALAQRYETEEEAQRAFLFAAENHEVQVILLE